MDHNAIVIMDLVVSLTLFRDEVFTACNIRHSRVVIRDITGELIVSLWNLIPETDASRRLECLNVRLLPWIWR